MGGMRIFEEMLKGGVHIQSLKIRLHDVSLLPIEREANITVQLLAGGRLSGAVVGST